MLTYKQLQTALKEFRAQGLTTIKLNATKAVLQAEYDRLTTVTETVTEAVTEAAPLVTFHSFRDIIRQRKSSFRPKAHGFKIVKPEKRYDQLTIDEWREDTLAFLDDYIIYDECDYMAA